MHVDIGSHPPAINAWRPGFCILGLIGAWIFSAESGLRDNAVCGIRAHAADGLWIRAASSKARTSASEVCSKARYHQPTE